MNRIYSKVWNQSTGQVAVASELAKAKGKGKGARMLQALVVTGALASAPVFAADVCEQTGDGTTPPSATQPGALACGNGAQATGAGSTAVGSNARATAANASAVGNNARGLGANSTAVGSNALANVVGTTALGSSTQAMGERSTAVGFQSQAHADGAIAVGFNAYVGPTASGSVALGWGARAIECEACHGSGQARRTCPSCSRQDGYGL